MNQDRCSLDGEIAIPDPGITRRASARIGEYAARLAMSRPRKQLYVAHKANVLPMTQGLFMNTVLEEASRFPKVKTQDIIIDNCAMQLVRNPERFDVIVTTNLFGDIISDLTAGLVGGLGIAASGNIGTKHAVFEPVHGSAPDIAGKGIANPAATILSAVMMLEHLGEHQTARRVEAAVDRVLEEGPRTPDLGGSAHTMEFAEAVAKAL